MPTELEDRLVTTGRRLLEESGIGGVTVREVARRCGVSHGAPRRHFPTLTALLAAVADVCLQELRQTLWTGDASLMATATAYVEYAVAHPHAFDLVTRHDLLADSGRNLRATSLPLLAQWHEQYVNAVAHATPEESTAAWAAVHGVATLASRRALDLVGVTPSRLLSELLP